MDLKTRRQLLQACVFGPFAQAMGRVVPGLFGSDALGKSRWGGDSSLPFISNVRESTISTDDIDESIHFYVEHFGFQVERTAEIRERAWQQLWRLPPQTWARAALLSVAGAKTGSLRLVQFFPTSQIHAHLPFRPLDTGYGGIDMEVPDMTTRFESIVRHGHARVNAPIYYEPPNSSQILTESVVLGPTGERIPMVFYRDAIKNDLPMATDPEYTPVLAVFQIVPDLKAAAEVYLRLGLKVTRMRETSIPSVNRALGIPVDTRYRAYQLSNPAERFGRPIVVQYVNKQGENPSAISNPPNLGLIMTSYQVADVDAALQRLADTEAEVVSPPLRIQNPLYGNCRAMTFKHPGGSWVELYT
jgi:catechol 2,3-dioxygenase-like lactoylglutathione lyase family enzyme